MDNLKFEELIKFIKQKNIPISIQGYNIEQVDSLLELIINWINQFNNQFNETQNKLGTIQKEMQNLFSQIKTKDLEISRLTQKIDLYQKGKNE
ncbi:hypothetical protein [Mycoplasma leonicaptivi]|uniref:hypothetical protein n=1 Tax=Mycoplasma leonicaptivi TaxID=36742 RepID=UPI00047FED7E|nr:hypothetical protein [Mycoplasma leonicaptivi]